MLDAADKAPVGPEGFAPVRLRVGRGIVEARHYPAPGTRLAAVFVGGVGGWDTPARGLYPRLCAEMPGLGIAGLRVRFRDPTDLLEAVPDVLAGIEFLSREGALRVALVGHSFGGAAAIRAAAADPRVRAVVTLAAQGCGAGNAARLGPRCALLLLHGREDRVLPAANSEYLFGIAAEPKDIHIFDGTEHELEAAADRVHALTRDWIVRWLAEPPRPEPGEGPPDPISAPAFPVED